jgi:hypothetical protein
MQSEGRFFPQIGETTLRSPFAPRRPRRVNGREMAGESGLFREAG